MVIQDVNATFANILTLLQIYLIIPNCKASGKRSFKALEIVKTYLGSNLEQGDLDELLLLYRK